MYTLLINQLFSNTFSNLISILFNIFSYDLRRSGPETARHWTDSHVLGGRAFFQMAGTPARLRVQGSTTPQKRKRRRSVLRIRDVTISDRGMYRCRVDFQGAPTRNSKANLTVIGKKISISFGK